MPVLEPTDWLDWHCASKAQACATRLSASCAAVLPSDKNFQMLHEEQILSDLVGLAIHGRRSMERRKQKSASIDLPSLWPASKTPVPANTNLWDVFGSLIHATSIEVVWEEPELNPNPYKGRAPRFAGSVCIISDQISYRVPIGSIVAAYIGNFQNNGGAQEQKEAN